VIWGIVKRVMEIFDFGIGWVGETEEYLFIEALRSECAQRGLRFLVVNERSVARVAEQIRKNKVKISFFLDLASETTDLGDKFTRFVYRLKDSGSRVVADPDQARFAADKSITHFNLEKAGLSVPYTIVIRNWEPTRRLSEEEKQSLGLPFVIKPASGYAQKGVKIIRKRLSLREIAEARTFSPGDNFLLQQFVEPEILGQDPAWFRVIYLFGETVMCWWNTATGVYRQVTLRDFDDFNLAPLARIAAEIAGITGIEWFSCEIARDKKNSRFTVIDYMNDQFDISSQTQHSAGVPDDVLIFLAQRLVEKAWRHVKGGYPLFRRAIWFTRMKLRDEDA